MKHAIIGATLLASVALAGCAQLTSDVNGARDWLASPATTQATANLRAGAAAFVCAVQSASALAQEIETDANVKNKAAIRDTKTIYVVSSDLCGYLGGKVTGAAVVPASALAAP